MSLKHPEEVWKESLWWVIMILSVSLSLICRKNMKKTPPKTCMPKWNHVDSEGQRPPLLPSCQRNYRTQMTHREKEDKCRLSRWVLIALVTQAPSSQYKPSFKLSHCRLIQQMNQIMWPMLSCASWHKDRGRWNFQLPGRKVPPENLPWCLSAWEDPDYEFHGEGWIQKFHITKSSSSAQPLCRHNQSLGNSENFGDTDSVVPAFYK